MPCESWPNSVNNVLENEVVLREQAREIPNTIHTLAIDALFRKAPPVSANDLQNFNQTSTCEQIDEEINVQETEEEVIGVSKGGQEGPWPPEIFLAPSFAPPHFLKGGLLTLTTY